MVSLKICINSFRSLSSEHSLVVKVVVCVRARVRVRACICLCISVCLSICLFVCDFLKLNTTSFRHIFEQNVLSVRARCVCLPDGWALLEVRTNTFRSLPGQRRLTVKTTTAAAADRQAAHAPRPLQSNTSREINLFVGLLPSCRCGPEPLVPGEETRHHERHLTTYVSVVENLIRFLARLTLLGYE